ncbi:predicted protein [Phaeodactylum tricornutum CCAP 1055/1]|jgi:hypothetical protein|uniref:Uncharacterized protein n=1 Tax=Phaeodactylum tricornutum (strain CCAP 1055/1) TaxID=556484 RepID=B7G0S7_PHATC|nr:predicted protein [Phaeodactylum tricornutum CCAP 1055/1]EEC47942.1 predicted protein [Phaeodactylum tricornutum CCAP 1055/1]|eukprot:XP_002180534.1 predicted protein [Phaeodactylum tricornutum CCAP 1055/1]
MERRYVYPREYAPEIDARIVSARGSYTNDMFRQIAQTSSGIACYPTAPHTHSDRDRSSIGEHPNGSISVNKEREEEMVHFAFERSHQDSDLGIIASSTITSCSWIDQCLENCLNCRGCNSLPFNSNSLVDGLTTVRLAEEEPEKELIHLAMELSCKGENERLPRIQHNSENVERMTRVERKMFELAMERSIADSEASLRSRYMKRCNDRIDFEILGNQKLQRV